MYLLYFTIVYIANEQLFNLKALSSPKFFSIAFMNPCMGLVKIFHASGGGGRIDIKYNNSDFLIENILCNGGEIGKLPEEYDISDALGENGTIVINGIITQSPE